MDYDWWLIDIKNARRRSILCSRFPRSGDDDIRNHQQTKSEDGITYNLKFVKIARHKIVTLPSGEELWHFATMIERPWQWVQGDNSWKVLTVSVLKTLSDLHQLKLFGTSLGDEEITDVFQDLSYRMKHDLRIHRGLSLPNTTAYKC